MSKNIYLDNWKANKAKQELELWKDQIIHDIKTYIDNSLDAIKSDIIKGINQHTNVYIDTYLNGTKTDFRKDITDYVVNELMKSIR